MECRRFPASELRGGRNLPDRSRLDILSGINELEQIGADCQFDGRKSDSAIVVIGMATADAGFRNRSHGPVQIEGHAGSALYSEVSQDLPSHCVAFMGTG